MAARSKVRLISQGAKNPQEIDSAVAAIAAQGAGAFLWIADPFLNQQLRQTAEQAMKRRLPSIGVNPRYAEAGGLMSYGASPEELWRYLAQYVDKIFKGANPADLPVEQPRRIRLVVNQQTAKTLGLTIPPELLVLADKVIE